MPSHSRGREFEPHRLQKRHVLRAFFVDEEKNERSDHVIVENKCEAFTRRASIKNASSIRTSSTPKKARFACFFCR